MEFEQIVKLGEHLKYLVDNLSPRQIEALGTIIIVSLLCLIPIGAIAGIAIFSDSKVE